MSPWEVVTTGYLDAWMPMAIKGGKIQLTNQIQCRCQYGQTGQKSCTTSTLTVRNGEAVTHHFSYRQKTEKTQKRFRPWLTRAEFEEGQYSRSMPRLHLDDPMAYRNFIPPELYQELGQKITVELQRDRTLMRDPVKPGVKLAVTLRHLTIGDSYITLQYVFRVAIEKFVPEV